MQENRLLKDSASVAMVHTCYACTCIHDCIQVYPDGAKNLGNIPIYAAQKDVICFLSLFISHRGKDNKSAAAFRADYGRLGELRSLLKKDVPFICLTATATDKTREVIVKELCMEEYVVVDSDPNRPNTKYSVVTPKTDNLYGWFEWLIRELETEQQNTEKVIIFCRRKEHMKELYELFAEHLGDKSYYRPTGTEPKDDRSRLFAMYHKRTHKLVKETIEKEFCKPDGIVRVLFCSIAFGMGVNVRNVYLDIHIGPSADVDDYLQETGRIGRDSQQMSHAVLLKFKGCTGTKNISKDMRSYVNNTTQCRREMLLAQFKSSAPKDKVPHSCCDVCAMNCKCLCFCDDSDRSCELKCEQEKHISRIEKFLLARDTSHDDDLSDKVNTLSRETVQAIWQQLMDYRSALAAVAKDKLFTGIDVATGYSKQLIDSIISGIAYIRDREYLKSNFPFYSEDHVTKTWEILECHLKGNQETLSDTSSESDNSDTTDASKVDSSDDESSTSDSPVLRRRKHKINGIIFSDASTSEVDSD